MSVQPVKWLGICDACGEPSPEERDSFEAALDDIHECPCGEGDPNRPPEAPDVP